MTSPGFATARSTGLVLLGSFSLALLSPMVSTATPAPKRIVALYWYGRDFPPNDSFDRTLRKIFQSQPYEIEYYAEYLESNRFPGDDQTLALRDYLHRKYSGLAIDVAIANSSVSLAFLLEHRDYVLPNAPIVFFSSAHTGVQERARALGFGGVVISGEYRESLRLGLTLHPSTRQVFVILGLPQAPGFPHGSASIEMDLRKELQEFENRISVHYLIDLPLGELIGRIRHLPRDSLILYTRQSQDAPGQVLGPGEVLRLLTESASAPIYGVAEGYIGRGAVGGYVPDREAAVLQTAEIALRTANGAHPRDIKIKQTPLVPMFDWRQLQRWHIPEARLPANSIVLFREPTLWEQFKWQITTALLAGLILILMIAVLLVERQRRRKDAEALRRTNAMLTDSMAEIKLLSGRIMSAQEDERRRISRELHDDVSQRIALLAMRLSTLKRSLSNPAATRENLTVLQSDVMRLANSVQTLSHELHPALLERAGLPAALRSHVEEFGGLHGLRIHFNEALIRTMPHDVGLCLYRITQEALRNVVRHSGSTEAWVSLTQVNGHIELSIRDSGRGFDPQSVRGSGIGLASMKERARLVGGIVQIDSRAGGGTVTRVLIPVSQTVVANP